MGVTEIIADLFGDLMRRALCQREEGLCFPTVEVPRKVPVEVPIVSSVILVSEEQLPPQPPVIQI